MSFFTKHGNTKFVGDWKVGDTEYSLLQTVKPILDAGVFSIKTAPEGEAITGGVTLQAGTGVSLAVDAESKTITLDATSSYSAGSGISISGGSISLNLMNYVTSYPIIITCTQSIDLTASYGMNLSGNPFNISGGNINIGNTTGTTSIIRLRGELEYNDNAINTTGGIAVVGEDGKLPASILPEAGDSFDPTDYQGALNLTNTTDVVNVASLVSNGTNIYLSYSNAENNTVVDLSSNKLDIGVKTAATGETITFDLTDGVSISSEAGLKYNGAALNAANGLVQLGSNGKIPSNLYEAGSGTGGEIDWANVLAPGDIYLQAIGDVSIESGDTGTVTLINGIEQNKIEIKQDSLDITAEGGPINLLASQEIFIGDLSGQLNCTFSSELISLSANELVLGAMGAIDLNVTAVMLNGTEPNTAGGFAIVEDNGKLPESILPNFVITDGTTEVNTKKITLGEGLEVVAGAEGEAIIQRKRRTAIEFTVDDLSENKLLVSESMVGDFVVVDADGVMVIPVIQQIGNDVQIDFTDWTVTGTWKVIFR